MAKLIAKIESFLLEAPLEAICSGSIFYLTMEDDKVADYNTIRSLNDRAITLKALNIPQESDPDCTREEIVQNFRTLRSKLSSPMTIVDGILYDALKSGIGNSVDVSELTWRDPIASTVLSDDSVVEPRENMRCKLPDSVSFKCVEFVNNFNEIGVPDCFRNITHNGLWKENESDLEKIAERILTSLGDLPNDHGVSYKNSICRPICNQFGVVGIQKYCNCEQEFAHAGARTGYFTSSSK
ncbi:467_t:CDS:2, partial [Entrophospora sp. SA101]